MPFSNRPLFACNVVSVDNIGTEGCDFISLKNDDSLASAEELVLANVATPRVPRFRHSEFSNLWALMGCVKIA